MLLAQSLQRVGVEFSIITFGNYVRVLKLGQDEWNPLMAWMVLSQLRFDDPATMDADAVYCALDLLMSARGPKKVFMFTDGFGTSGLRLTAALRKAENDNVQVIGVSVGLDKFHVGSCYQHWIECALPKYLPDALRALFEQEDDLDKTSPDNLWYKQFLQQRARIGSDGRPEPDMSIDDIINAHTNAFETSLIDELRKERETELSIDRSVDDESLSVDIAFLLDITGSFAPYMEVAMTQIKAILTGIQPAVDIKFPGWKIAIHAAIIGYRDDIGNNYSATTLPFTEISEESFGSIVQPFLLTLVAQGGDDIPEDVHGAFAAALLPKDQGGKLEWKSKSKTIVLLTDAPGHGPHMHDFAEQEDRAYTTPSLKPHIDTMIKREINLFVSYASETNTKKMLEHMQQCYNDIRLERLMVSVPLVSESTVAPDPIVFILCLDESNSMRGAPWTCLVQAYTEFLQKRIMDQGGDGIVVINFADRARYICGPDPVAIRSAPALTFAGGKTKFGPALTLAKEAIERVTNECTRFIMLFMTDGQSSDGAGTNIIQAIAAKFTNGDFTRFTCHTVGFGSGVNVARLESMVAGGGRYHAASVGNDLVKAFHAVAEDATGANVMAGKLAKNIVDSVVTKLVADYL